MVRISFIYDRDGFDDLVECRLFNVSSVLFYNQTTLIFWRGRAERVLFPLVASIGVGTFFQVLDTMLTCTTLANSILSDPSHCSASCNAYERYGDQYRGVHFD